MFMWLGGGREAGGKVRSAEAALLGGLAGSTECGGTRKAARSEGVAALRDRSPEVGLAELLGTTDQGPQTDRIEHTDNSTRCCLLLSVCSIRSKGSSE